MKYYVSYSHERVGRLGFAGVEVTVPEPIRTGECVAELRREIEQNTGADVVILGMFPLEG